MFQKSNLEESIELWGESFSRSKFGLDEMQVKAFIGRLISEREILLERNKQFKALATQAEKITLEADSVANEIYRKAEENAQAQARLILDRAREQANELMEQKRIISEILTRRQEEAIIASAQEAAQKCIREAEEKAEVRAKAIIKRALVEGNELFERKRVEADINARKEMELVKAQILTDAQRRLKESEEEAEAMAQSQAEAILSSSWYPPIK